MHLKHNNKKKKYTHNISLLSKTAHQIRHNAIEATRLVIFRRLNKEFGQTIVMVTHELEEGKKADRIIWIKDGLLDNIKNKKK